ncbi:MAG: hypothetical protein ACRC9U_02290 [Metamycoplasmataceae bacterium]
MILKIEIEDKKTVVAFGKHKMWIYEGSEEWTLQKINEFLINLSSATPDGEKIEIEYNKEIFEEKNDLIYNHIVSLFKEFVNEYNRQIEKQ